MEFTAVTNSSAISGVHYDAELKELTIRFKHGTAHTYRGVPEEKYQGLMAAESIGQYFYQNIRNDYPSEKVGDEIAV